MNCPSHCVIFGSKRRSYRELPWRVADFGRLHRYERGGVVHGLARVRSFAQDDAHIFCAEEPGRRRDREVHPPLPRGLQGVPVREDRHQARDAAAPDKRIGSRRGVGPERARPLPRASSAPAWSSRCRPGEGAFYGPKIEFHVQDALKRSWQLGTIQYDPNLPERFDLSYIGEDGKEHRPVMLHRAIFGSLERFFGVYLEHCGGNFPAWLAPKQAIVLTVSEKSDAYARQVVERLRDKGLRVEADLSSDKLGAKIRNARPLRYPYMLVVGPKEAESDSVGVRSRDAGELGAMKLEELAARLLAEARPPAAGRSVMTPRQTSGSRTSPALTAVWVRVDTGPWTRRVSLLRRRRSRSSNVSSVTEVK